MLQSQIAIRDCHTVIYGGTRKTRELAFPLYFPLRVGNKLLDEKKIERIKATDIWILAYDIWRFEARLPKHSAHNSIGGSEHVAVLLGRLRMAWLLRHFPPRVVWALYVMVNGFITIALLASLAVVTDSPFVFPSLGPTAYLLFIAP